MPVSEELSIRAELLAEGGPRLWERFMAELRTEHLGGAAPRTKLKRPSVRSELQAAYEAVQARAGAESDRSGC